MLAAQPDQMVALSEWLHGLPIILKIPDDSIETIAKAQGPSVDYDELRAP